MKPSALIIRPRKYFYVQYLHTFPQFMQAGPIKDNISASCTMLTSLVYYKYKNAVTGVICTFVLCLLAWQIVHDIMGKGIHSVKILGKNPIHNDLNLVIRFFFLPFFFSLPLWNGIWDLNLCGQKELNWNFQKPQHLQILQILRFHSMSSHVLDGYLTLGKGSEGNFWGDWNDGHLLCISNFLTLSNLPDFWLLDTSHVNKVLITDLCIIFKTTN